MPRAPVGRSPADATAPFSQDAVKYENGREIRGQSVVVEWARGPSFRPPAAKVSVFQPQAQLEPQSLPQGQQGITFVILMFVVCSEGKATSASSLLYGTPRRHKLSCTKGSCQRYELALLAFAAVQ
ncbi:hypothetical protein HPB47_013755 [Ixodes persulcatus]|uniref:Uncharacterized protein n=1 Tax=Ixodes persulcatus TaxID=34615 RepID=A0AC60QXQ2_IXOPE|nr:hypothetical protein HPB47_013755 [Ixodes persulcatus]